MTPEEFAYICKLVHERTAIVLEPGKEYLVETRLTPLLQEQRLHSLGELVLRLKTQPYDGLAVRVAEAMTTNETLFFRDHQPFEALRKFVLPDLIQKRREQRRLNIWCAACATGQEPYSVALLLREHFPELASWSLTLLATDLSREVLERAKAGRFSQIEVHRGLPAPLLVKYFRQQGVTWELRPEIRSLVEFREMNLAQPWPSLPTMDLVLLRNVLIYFDLETKQAIFRRLGRLLRPDSYLLLGSAETTFNIDDSYRRVEQGKVGFYQRNSS
jgi:chemotaxis protein methyltransferase CheR